MNRNLFLKSITALGAGLLVGEEAIEMFNRLNHKRKSFPSADLYKNIYFETFDYYNNLYISKSINGVILFEGNLNDYRKSRLVLRDGIAWKRTKGFTVEFTKAIQV